MKRAIPGTILFCCAVWFAAGQSPEALPKFEAADVHASAKNPGQFMQYVRVAPVHKGRYEIKTATMVDLIHQAYGIDSDKILGGPNWLEMDRFDVIAKVPEDTTADAQKLMLQSLLADRFKLVLHKDTKPLPAYALVVAKNGCKLKPVEGGHGSRSSWGRGKATMERGSMEGLANALSRILDRPVADETGLQGVFNFTLEWTPDGAEEAGASIFTAIQEQLGLKLEPRKVPAVYIVVDKAEKVPLEN